MMEIEINHHDTLEDVIKILLEERDKNNSAYLNFVGKTLYSDDITLEKAYLEVLGKTKDEFEQVLNMFNNIYDEDVVTRTR